jgi:glutathione S-transferase
MAGRRLLGHNLIVLSGRKTSGIVAGLRSATRASVYTLYARAGTGSAAIEAIFEEAEVPYELQTVVRDADGRPSEAFLDVNPLGQVPALRLQDGSIMTESAAMIIHLADQLPHARLSPPLTSPLRPHFLRWIVFLATNVYTSDLRVYYSERYTTDPAGAAAVRAAGVAAMAREWSIFAEALGAKAYVLGDTYSAADIYAALLATWNEDVPLFFKTHPNVKALCDRVTARPAIARVWKRNGM